MIDSSGRELPVLRELCGLHGGEHQVFQEQPKNHFYKPPGTAVAAVPVRRPRPATGRFQREEPVAPPSPTASHSPHRRLEAIRLGRMRLLASRP